ncbi:MAG: class II fructose-bisphosphatase [Actinomycetota bacterium]|nr:class II fructose-bisphosphatase [Actinomycetota bacterium]
MSDRIGAAHTRAPDRNLALELVRATEAAALAAGRWMGRNDKNGCDQAAVDAMRQLLSSVPMDGVVVIGEGEKDEAPMLFNGEEIGTGAEPRVDVAVDPIDGTRLLAEGRPGSLAVIAVAPRGTMFDPGPMLYMMKWVVGPDAAGAVDVDAPVGENLRRIATAKGIDVSYLTVAMLDRPRHEEMMREVREAGARLQLIMDGDVATSLQATMPEMRVDVTLGIGGTPEGVITACGVRAAGGEMHGRLWARDDDDRRRAAEQGYDLSEALTTERLVSSPNTFLACTGITTGELVRGVTYGARGAVTDSLCMRGESGTVRWVRATHSLQKVREYTPS